MNDAVKCEELTPEEWQRRCAARFMSSGAVGEKPAIEMAREAWAINQQEPADLRFGPEEAADEDMACWEDDGDE